MTSRKEVQKWFKNYLTKKGGELSENVKMCDSFLTVMGDLRVILTSYNLNNQTKWLLNYEL